MKRLLVLAFVLLTVNAPARAFDNLGEAYLPYLGHLPAHEQRWFEAAFRLYAKAFIEPDGRVVDPQNGGITHSESQGYGMLLALLGNDRETFDRLWRFARDRMQRADKLFAWKWVPGQGIADRNNATDGDILIATALALGGMRWSESTWLGEAEAIAEAAGRKLITQIGGYHVLLPGEWAIPNHYASEVTVNLSYLIPLTLPILEALAPQHAWEQLLPDGVRMIDSLAHPPSDWSEVDRNGDVVPSPRFPPSFGYDAVRIPLYFLQSGRKNDRIAQQLSAIWGDDDRRDLFSFDVVDIFRLEKFWGNAYAFMYEMLTCVESGEPIAYDSMALKMTNYFDSSLHLMALAAMYASWPECFPADDHTVAGSPH